MPSDWRAEFNHGTLSITAVPEPGTWAQWLAGVLAVARVARRGQDYTDKRLDDCHDLISLRSKIRPSSPTTHGFGWQSTSFTR